MTMGPASPEPVESLEAGRQKLLRAIGDSDDLTFIRIHGNLGDELIYAGARQLLSGLFYREIDIRSVEDAGGHTALIAGGGSWCEAYQEMPGCLREVEKRFERVIVLPSSFEASVPVVKEALLNTKALVFARERESYRQIRDLCLADLTHDCALFFDFRPYRRPGRGVLNAFRTDREGLPVPLPPDNDDVSVTAKSLDEWLWTIARHEVVQTDRAHVTIAAAMLGKRVRYRPSNYHKVPGIIDYSLGGLLVEPIPEAEPAADRSDCAGGRKSRAVQDGELAWVQRVRRAAQEIARVVPEGGSFILVDGDLLGSLPIFDRHAIPFLERGGLYFGAPADDATALSELRRLLEAEPSALVFAWPAFWWLEQYSLLREYLNKSFPCVLRSEDLVVFDLGHSLRQDA